MQHPRPDSSALVAAVRSAELRFLASWQSAWIESNERSPARWFDLGTVGGRIATASGASPPPRGRQYWCRSDMADNPDRDYSGTLAVGAGWIIRSVVPMRGVCPSWFLGPGSPPWDERLSIDASLSDADRHLVRAKRDSLLELLDSAAARLPADDWIAGQRIRFVLDQDEVARALVIARDCRGTPWWCALLAGYAEVRGGNANDAEVSFARALTLMPPEARCDWSSVAELLELDARAKYLTLSCEQQDSLNARVWWLADPLFVEPGNERFVEQVARKVLLSLVRSVPRDERFEWQAPAPADARAEMILRYGWPSFVYFDFPSDALRSDALAARWRAGFVHPQTDQFATFEYSAGRMHLVPSWAALSNPFAALTSDWTLSAPAGADSTPAIGTALPPIAPEFVNGHMIRLSSSELSDYRADHIRWQTVVLPKYWQRAWRPVEHYQPSRTLMQIPDGQVAILRREANDILATSNVLPLSSVRQPTASDTRLARLVVTDRPDSVVGVASTPLSAVLRLHGPIPARPAVVGIEYMWSASEAAGGRTRFGIVPPVPLSAMKRSDVSISDPVFLEATPDDQTISSDPDSALARMTPSCAFPRSPRLGLYWETYGFAPSNSVSIDVKIEHRSVESFLRRLGRSLGVLRDRNSVVSVGWRESRLGPTARLVSGPVPAIARTLILDTSRLVPGAYELEISMARFGQSPVRSHKTFVLQ